MLAGTRQSECSHGQCHCHRQTGACPCREHVEGPNCDRCAPHHWNYGQAGGCEPCACDPDHSTGADCNMVMAASTSLTPHSNRSSLSLFMMLPACPLQFSGQCHCHPGFGGRQCTECEQFHWGDPREQCQGNHPPGESVFHPFNQTFSLTCLITSTNNIDPISINIICNMDVL